MADALFIVITLCFFAGAGAFVRACERIIGPDEARPVAAPVPAAVPVADLVAERAAESVR